MEVFFISNMEQLQQSDELTLTKITRPACATRTVIHFQELKFVYPNTHGKPVHFLCRQTYSGNHRHYQKVA